MLESDIIQMGGNNEMIKVETNKKDRVKAQKTKQNMKVIKMPACTPMLPK